MKLLFLLSTPLIALDIQYEIIKPYSVLERLIRKEQHYIPFEIKQKDNDVIMFNITYIFNHRVKWFVSVKHNDVNFRLRYQSDKYYLGTKIDELELMNHMRR